MASRVGKKDNTKVKKGKEKGWVCAQGTVNAISPEKKQDTPTWARRSTQLISKEEEMEGTGGKGGNRLFRLNPNEKAEYRH